MKVSYIFSKNSKIGSKLICWASKLILKDLENTPSHVAVLLDDNLIMESNFKNGVYCVPFFQWIKNNEICYIIEDPRPRTSQEIYSMFSMVWGDKYDWFGILYFAKCFISHYLFKTPFPSTNKWQSPNRYFCTEFAGFVAGYYKYCMTTPAKMCYDFLQKTRT